jgi:hypothetical protein
MYEVRNGNRTLKFEGRHLASSSSKRPGAVRWIEFDLYKTNGGKYVLSRVGVSHVFHSSTCPLVSRYGLHEAHSEDLSTFAVPCAECNPESLDPVVYPETYRYWTLVSDEPDAILEALYKPDDHGVRYLTRVAERLLQDAAAQDADLDMLYRFEYID